MKEVRQNNTAGFLKTDDEVYEACYFENNNKVLVV